MNDKFELVRGSDNPFRDLGIPHANAELMKAGLATGIIRISRIRKADFNRCTIDRLVKIHNRLDRGTRIRVDFSQPRDGGQAGTAHP